MYDKIYQWLEKREYAIKIVRFLSTVLPYLVAAIFLSLLMYLFLLNDGANFLRIGIVCVVTFLLETLIRKLINAPRPYQQGRKGWIEKKTKGKSFPSRHAVSVTIIAISCVYMNYYSALMIMLTMAINILRYITGVHYAKDILAGIVFALFCGIIGYWVI